LLHSFLFASVLWTIANIEGDLLQHRALLYAINAYLSTSGPVNALVWFCILYERNRQQEPRKDLQEEIIYERHAAYMTAAMGKTNIFPD